MLVLFMLLLMQMLVLMPILCLEELEVTGVETWRVLEESPTKQGNSSASCLSRRIE